MRKRYYYHLTDEIWPERILLRPRSTGKSTPGRPKEEPKDARICVCPTPWHCLIAVGGLYFNRKVHIYRTLRRVTAVEPRDVTDANITMEMWITHPVQFIRLKSIPLKNINNLKLPACVGGLSGLKRQIKALPKSEKLIRSYFPEDWGPQYIFV